MRIKFNDKIYRLKEVESGVDSLMELVEEQKYKNGDFVCEDGRIMIVKSYPNMFHALAHPEHSDTVYYNSSYVVDFSSPTFRHAAEEERQILIDEMRKDGKRWNDDEKCVEDIPQRRFKVGDKVRIKDGISSKNTNGSSLYFHPKMDEFIGKEMNVVGYRVDGWISCDPGLWCFDEDWLEPYTDELKKGDLAIFWNNGSRHYASVRMYGGLFMRDYCDTGGVRWDNAIKFESKEQFERFIKGDL